MKNMKKTEKFTKSNTFSQVVEPRDFETDERMAYYQAKHYSPWFDKLKPKNRGRVKKKLVLEQKKLTPQTPNGCSRGIWWSKSSGLKTRNSRCKWGQGCCQIGWGQKRDASPWQLQWQCLSFKVHRGASRGGGGGRPFNTKRVRGKILSQLEHSVSEDNQKVFSADRAAFQTRYRSIWGRWRKTVLSDIFSISVRQNGNAAIEHQHLSRTRVLDHKSRQSQTPILAQNVKPSLLRPVICGVMQSFAIKQRRRWSAAGIDFWKKAFYQSGAFIITNCAGIVGNELWRSMRWMAFIWNNVQCYGFHWHGCTDCCQHPQQRQEKITYEKVGKTIRGRTRKMLCESTLRWRQKILAAGLDWLSVGGTKSKMFRGGSAMLYKRIEEF